MTKRGIVSIILLGMLFAPGLIISGSFAASVAPQDRLSLAGTIKNPEGTGVKEADVEVLINGRHLVPEGKKKTIVTGNQGNFSASFRLPAGALAGASVEVLAHKPNWRKPQATAVRFWPMGQDPAGNALYQRRYGRCNGPARRCRRAC